MSRRRPVNYLNNKDMLKEIHKSKISFCYYIDEKYVNYDLILNSVDEINDTTIEEAKIARANKLSSMAYEEGVNTWYSKNNATTKPKQAEFKVNPSDIKVDDIVFRIMTYEHIPESPGRKKNPKIQADYHVKLNFPPFKHYAFIEGKWREVLRSHWENGLENGSFRLDHGTLTPKLAKMMVLLVDKYGTKGNWRGYSYNDEMKGAARMQLSEVGLKFNEAKSQNPFAYFTAVINNSFTRVLNLEKKNQNIRDDLLQESGNTPSFNRQIEDERNQQAARAEDEELLKQKQELKDAGFNY